MDPSILFAAAILVSDLKDGCGKYDMMQKVLVDDYGETPILNMVDHKNSTLELYANPTTLTWTVLIVDRLHNRSCIMDSGARIERVFKGKKADL